MVNSRICEKACRAAEDVGAVWIGWYMWYGTSQATGTIPYVLPLPQAKAIEWWYHSIRTVLFRILFHRLESSLDHWKMLNYKVVPYHTIPIVQWVVPLFCEVIVAR